MFEVFILSIQRYLLGLMWDISLFVQCPGISISDQIDIDICNTFCAMKCEEKENVLVGVVWGEAVRNH